MNSAHNLLLKEEKVSIPFKVVFGLEAYNWAYFVAADIKKLYCTVCLLLVIPLMFHDNRFLKSNRVKVNIMIFS